MGFKQKTVRRHFSAQLCTRILSTTITTMLFLVAPSGSASAKHLSDFSLRSLSQDRSVPLSLKSEDDSTLSLLPSLESVESETLDDSSSKPKNRLFRKHDFVEEHRIHSKHDEVPSEDLYLSLLSPVSNPLSQKQPNLSQGKVRRNKGRTAPVPVGKYAFESDKLKYLKKEWCKSAPFKQAVIRAGCRKRSIVNHFCYGQCNSFFIPPRTWSRSKKSAFTSCAVCTPVFQDVTVSLKCRGRKQRKKKKVKIVKECKCMAQRLA